ncbi:MAG: hypothetical protein AAF517_03215, partial [Planctomycetota bacterium]
MKRVVRLPARNRRRCTFFVAALASLSIYGCFPGPVEDLWPPKEKDDFRHVSVIFWDWHTVLETPVPPSVRPQGP